ncbi:uncharacterized protein LOC106172092 [Lingula anatina]|uniref:Uncharacterized protein LOC106172092 n=1 Tax=Lingula anatina TaxID=7574 RepID=A0A1S3JCU1_LINAN|nr:uncharacterized protein LOC106172092 [Lingula anatina]|eukprot:XP_013408138.1 uncharacterized protein LOC106172092 [Lingula anatina]
MITIGIVLFGLFYQTLAEKEFVKETKAVRCFDCNYSPSGFYPSGYERGYERCALSTYGDADFIDKWECRSGRCFIRQDKNGLVFRGCADEANVPYGVDPTKSCSTQGHAYWYFCYGDLCNDGQLGNNVYDKYTGQLTKDVCGYEPDQKEQPPYNPCAKNKCLKNPSGVYADPDNKEGFIQCGCGRDGYGKPCTCCVPLRLRCPYGTVFDEYNKECTSRYKYEAEYEKQKLLKEE